MKLKFEKVLPPDDYTRQVWKRRNRSNRQQEFYEAIEKMKVGESFEVEGVYRVMESIRAAFRMRGWKCTCRTKRVEPTKITKGLRVFKIRTWRIA